MKRLITLCAGVLACVPIMAIADISAALQCVYPIITYDQAGTKSGEGSVVMCSSNGIAVTCFHVLEDAAYSRVRVPSGEEIDVVGYLYADPAKDFVVVQLATSTNYHPIALGSSSDISVGDKVYTIGNPQGLSGTLADGIVSAMRETDEFGKVIQTTAPISPGSSGGALLDSNGRLIGITKFYMRDAQNLNFATPIDDIRPFLSGQDVKPLKTLPSAISQFDAGKHADDLLSVIAEGGIFTKVALTLAGKPESLKKSEATFPIYIIGLVENTELTKAEKEVKEFLKTHARSDNLVLAIAYFYLAKAEFEKTLENNRQAAEYYKRAGETAFTVLKRDKSKPLACALYLQALFGLGEYELLEQNSAAAVRTFPDSHFPWHMRLFALAFTGRFEEARRFSDALLSNQKMDRGSVHYWRGMIKVMHISQVRQNSQYSLARGLATEAVLEFRQAANNGNAKAAMEGLALLQKMGY